MDKYDSLKGIQQKSNLSDTFFSIKNVNVLQLQIIQRVFKKTQVTIGKQSQIELNHVMRSIYFSESRNLEYSIEDQVRQLNESVLRYCVDNIVTNLRQHQVYLKHISEGHGNHIMSNAINTSLKGSKTLELPNFF